MILRLFAEDIVLCHERNELLEQEAGKEIIRGIIFFAAVAARFNEAASVDRHAVALVAGLDEDADHGGDPSGGN